MMTTTKIHSNPRDLVEIVFDTIEDFNAWKINEETTTDSTFSEVDKLKANDAIIYFYFCDQAFPTRVTSCQAKILLYTFVDTPLVKVFYYPIHNGQCKADSTKLTILPQVEFVNNKEEEEKNEILFIRKTKMSNIQDKESDSCVVVDSWEMETNIIQDKASDRSVVVDSSEMQTNVKSDPAKIGKKPTPDTPLSKITLLCDICCQIFHNVPDLRHHYQDQHSVELILGKNRTYICPICRHICSNRTYYYMHLLVTHCLQFNAEKHEFDNMKDFKTWKKQQERSTESFYVGDKNHHELDFLDETSVEVTNDSRMNVSVFVCNLSKTFQRNGIPSSYSTRTKLPRINATCPSFMYCVENSETGKVEATYYPVHHGHGIYKRYGPQGTKIIPKELKQAQHTSPVATESSNYYCNNSKLLWREHSYSFLHPDETPIPVDMLDDSSNDRSNSLPGNDGFSDDDDDRNLAPELFGHEEYRSAIKSITDPDIDQILDRIPDPQATTREQVEINNLQYSMNNTNINCIEPTISMADCDIENYARQFRLFWSAANDQQKELFHRIAFG